MATTLRAGITTADFDRRSAGFLPGWFGLKVAAIEAGRLVLNMEIRPEMLAPNGFLHAAAVVALADTACGYATIAHLPEGAESFTTIELKSNFLGTAREGTIACVAHRLHSGRTTQVWDATVTLRGAAKPMAQFRCTQMILWPKG